MTVVIQMSGQISFAPYSRAFRQPLHTAHGHWSERRGFIVRVEDSEGVGYGEIAPIPTFGTESLESAEAFLKELVVCPEIDVPVELPCCAFGLSAASIRGNRCAQHYAISALLPAGEGARARLLRKIEEGYTSFKWKIGVHPTAIEIGIARDLFACLPKGCQLRLDANGGLDRGQLEAWISALSEHRHQVEYLEQPLAVGQEALMATYMDRSGLPIALDESLNGVDGRSWIERWKGPLVIKPALMGSVENLSADLADALERVIVSSVFETSVGIVNALDFVDSLSDLKRPIGFDTLDTFDDSLQLFQAAPTLSRAAASRTDLENLWQKLDHSS